MATQTVTFFSNASEYELVRQPRNDKPVPSGVGWINETKGVKYKFMPAVDESGRLVGRRDFIVGQDVLVDTMGWLAPDQEQGVEREVVTALRAHKALGRDFWEMPTPANDIRRAIRKASVALDSDALVALIESERATFNRADLLSEAEDALGLVQETRAEMAAAIAEQEQAEEFETPTVTPVETPKPKAKAKPKAPASA